MAEPKGVGKKGASYAVNRVAMVFVLGVVVVMNMVAKALKALAECVSCMVVGNRTPRRSLLCSVQEK